MNTQGVRVLLPWLDWDEWEHVYSGLFSSDDETVRQALKRVVAWKSRGNVPLAVLSTADLVEIDLYYKQLRGCQWNSGYRSESEVAKLYSMSIIRMINGLVTPFHGLYAASIGSVAKQIGLPKELVEIRHGASHDSTLPSLKTLKDGSILALDWLQSNYWEQQKSILSETKNDIWNHLKSFEQIQKEWTTKEKMGLNRSKDMKRGSKVLKEIQEICTNYHVNITLIPYLLDKNLLVPKKSKYKPFSKLPERLKLMWGFPLQRFGEYWSHFNYTFLLSLVQSIIESKNLRNENPDARNYRASLLVCWYNYLIDYCSTLENVYLPLTPIVSLCSEKLDKWTIKVLRKTYSLDFIKISLKMRIESVLNNYEEAQEIRKFERKRKAVKRKFDELPVQFDFDIDEFEQKKELVIEQRIKKKARLKLEKEAHEVGTVFVPVEPSDSGLFLIDGRRPDLSLPEELDMLKGAQFLKKVRPDETFEDQSIEIQDISRKKVNQNTNNEEISLDLDFDDDTIPEPTKQEPTPIQETQRFDSQKIASLQKSIQLF
eukprot:TRINITY_DN13529_c0_g1_i1.p1 TRINITY_DN13529_c0_g1~~TRINITY_DN13529_c0_g1_i1.p1  ORF type:complete len:543 (+),score=113.67 TRINITY_DN13529_c0_g1_i1:1-1629(+)